MHSLQIPTVEKEDFERVFHNMSGGNYRLKRAIYYRMLARRRELEDEKTEFTSYNEYIAACSQLPEELMIHVFHLEQRPNGWDTQSKS